VKPKLQRNPYRYRRELPHITKADRPHFLTFNCWDRWVLPPSARTVVLDALLFGNGKNYELLIAVVMPDHVHALFTPFRDEAGDPLPISQVLQPIKSFTAHAITKQLKRSHPVWQAESLDHVLRHQESLDEKIEYIRQNPVRRGLAKNPEEYEWLWMKVPS
jgi:putative transposase